MTARGIVPGTSEFRKAHDRYLDPPEGDSCGDCECNDGYLNVRGKMGKCPCQCHMTALDRKDFYDEQRRDMYQDK